jgi:DNA-binding transcriptional LysR family regulator
MELRQLRYLIAVVENGTVRQAADRLHIAQPAISRQLKLLEEQVGFQLFVPKGRRILPTHAAITLAENARRWLADMAETRTRLAFEAAGQHGQLRVGFADDVLFGPASDTVTRFIASSRQVQIITKMMLTHEICAQVERNELDCGIIVGPAPASYVGLKRQHIARYPLCLALSRDHPIAKQQTVRLDQFRDDTFILAEVGNANGFATAIMESIGRTAINPTIRTGIFPTDMILNLVAAGIGVSIISPHAAKHRSDIKLCALADPPHISIDFITPALPSEFALSLYEMLK